MATNFPTSLDSLTNPATTDQLSSPSHAAQHANANDAIEALEAKVGVDGSTVTTSHAYKIAQLESDIQNSAGDFIPLSVLGQPSGPAELNADGNLIVPENKIIIEGATADAHELTLQAPDVTSDITVTLPNASGTLALTTDVSTAITNLVSSAPATLDTLNELATALGNDANFATTTATSIGNKVSKAGGDVIQASADAVIPLVVKGAASQSADYFQIQGSGGTVLAQFNSSNQFNVNYGSIAAPYGIRAGSNNHIGLAAVSAWPQNAAYLGIGVRGWATQTADLLQIQNSSGTAISGFSPIGQIFTGTTTPITAGAVSQAITAVSFTSTTATYTFTATAQTISVGEYVTVFGITPSGYNGTYQVTAVATISAGTSYSFTVANTTNATVTVGNGYFFPSASLSISTQNKAHTGLIIKAVSGQTAATMEIQNSAGNPVTWWDSAGGMTASQAVISTLYSGGFMNTGTLGYFNATTFSSSVIPVVVRGTTSQATDLTQWQNSSGTSLARISNTGIFVGGSFSSDGSQAAGTNIASQFGSTSATRIPMVVYGAASQTAKLQEWRNSAGNVVASTSVEGNGYFQANLNAASIGAGNNIGGASLTASPWSAVTTVSIIRGYTSQTADLTQWQNSSGAILTRITASGVIGTTQNIYANRYYYSSNGTDTGTSISFIDGANGGGLNIRNIDLGTPNAGFDNVVPLTISGNINQTANLQNWKNATGTVLSKVDSTGAMFTITPADSTNSTQVATTAYVKSNIANLVSSAPATLDTLNELATALGNDASFSTTVTNSIALKAPLASPALTGTPTAPTATAGTNTTQLATTAFVKTEITSSVQPGAVYQTSAPSSPAVGQIWIDSDQDVTTFDSNIIRRKSITATAGQTVFTTDLPFIDGFEQVFFNGLLLLKTSDYTTSGGNTVTLTSAAAVSDIVEIVSVTGANSVTTYTQAEVDALLAANTSVAPISISTNTNLAAKKRYFVTSASALTLTLPATPALNDEVQIVDASGNALTYNITVARNGKLINGNAGNLIIDVNGGWYTLVFTGNTYGWKVA